jgi:hypothetical protein
MKPILLAVITLVYAGAVLAEDREGFQYATEKLSGETAHIQTESRQNWVSPAVCAFPPEWREQHKQLMSKTFLSVKCVDFTGDGKDDFIALEKPTPKQLHDAKFSDLKGAEWWVTSSGEVIRHENIYHSDYDYRWFQKLGRDTVPVIISAFGYSDGINYKVKRLNLKTGSMTDLFYFKPVLIEKDGHQFHGYPWDVTSLRTLVRNGEVFLLAGYKPHRYEEEDNDNDGNQQQCIPVLYFEGTSTQRELAAIPEPEHGQWLSLETLIKKPVRREYRGRSANVSRSRIPDD